MYVTAAELGEQTFCCKDCDDCHSAQDIPQGGEQRDGGRVGVDVRGEEAGHEPRAHVQQQPHLRQRRRDVKQLEVWLRPEARVLQSETTLRNVRQVNYTR